MGTNIPSTIPEMIDWCVVHEGLWSTNATSIGISSAQATVFKNAVAEMSAKSAAADAARQASKNATMEFQDSVSDVRALGNAYILMIKAFAETTNNSGVYALAGITPSNPPGTLPAPNAPQTFGAAINPDGSLTIKWKVSQPTGVSGVAYVVSRRMVGQTAFSIVANVGSAKMYTDTTLPYGIDRVEYMVQPVRGNVMGPQSNVFALQFGSVGGGMSIANFASVPHAEPMKIAA
ncbi:MAG TPA: hypothetical protein PKE29_07780 [Phycisphaerales bacterium]|nr:hypothetical protein [Phycisphaerales bacterium]